VDVEVAPTTPVERRPQHGFARPFAGATHRQRERLATRLLELPDRGARLLRVAGGDDDPRPGPRETARHAEPDAAVAARDDRHVAFEIEHSAPPPSRLRVAAITLRRDTPARIAVVLLLVEHHDVVHLLTLGVRAFHRDRHRLPVLRDDPSEGLSDLPALLVRAV